MPESRVAIRYARALFRTSEEAGNTEIVQRELQDIQSLIEESEPLSAFLDRVTLSLSNQDAVVTALFKNRASESVTRFIRFLGNRRRLPILPDACEAYDNLYRESRNILIAHITSAFPLRDDQIETIKRKMHERYSKHIECTVNKDTALLGGFVIRVLDQVHDLSIFGKLEGLRRSMRVA